MGRLFGTDGIRGVANRYPMTAMMAVKTGMAVALLVKKAGFKSVIIGRDTRLSGEMLEAALTSGVTAMGVHVLAAGIIPTPGVARLTSETKEAGAGIVISASHNPYQDNGIKLFKSGGDKLSDAEEAAIETAILDTPDLQDAWEGDTGLVRQIPDAQEKYAFFLKSAFSPFSNTKQPSEELFKVVVDCSNGAASFVAKKVFSEPMFKAHFIFNTPDGKNINKNCGSQHTATLAKEVIKTRAHAGLALDGDADRLIAIDEKGSVLTGDMILAICAKHAKEKGCLANNLVVSTVMSNMGLSKALETLGITHMKTDVGDREVLKTMVKTGAVIGGEDSGHMIFLQYHTTGDGLLTALRLLEVMAQTGKKLSELASFMTVFPQILMNVEVDASRPDIKEIKPIADEIKAVEDELNGMGRVFIRYSGTQPLLRVMVEGPDQKRIEGYCRRICDRVKEHQADKVM